MTEHKRTDREVGLSHRASIPPVPEGTARPLWSVMIPTYNCAHYLRETLAGVLAQDPGPELMQIEVVDDCSTGDDPAAVVEELGRGRVAFYRQPRNLGYIHNFETCLQRSRGRLVHLLHGDDSVRDGFYRAMGRAFDSHPEIGAAFCRTIYIDEEGHWQSISPLEQPQSGILSNWLERIAVYQRLQVASIVVRRDVYERLGGFDTRMSCWCEDWEMWIRIAAHYPVWFEAEPLALYRQHSSSLTGRSIRSGANIRDVRKAIGIYQSYLPRPIGGELARRAREFYAAYAVHTAEELLLAGDREGARAQVREALRCSRSLNVLWLVARLLIESGARWTRRPGRVAAPHGGMW